WDDFAVSHKEGDKVSGQIKSITDFGVFIGLPGGIDGLIHLSDLSWNQTGEEAIRNFKKGDEVSAVVLAIDVEKERISLGVKQMDNDPFNAYTAINDKGAIVKGTVKTIEEKGAVIALDEEVEGYLRAAEISKEKVTDVSAVLAEGQEIEARIVNVDRKNRTINLSIKAKDQAEEADSLQKFSVENSGNAGTTSLGALLKAKLDGKNNE